MKSLQPSSVPRTLKPDDYIYWQQRVYRVVTLDPENALVLHVESLADAVPSTLSLLDLLASSSKSSPTPLFASSLEALNQQIEEHYGLLPGTMTHDLPESYVVKAHIVTFVVTYVRRQFAEAERKAAARGETLVARTESLRQVLSQLHKMKLSVSVRGEAKEHEIQMSLSTYYKYEGLYETYNGDEARIAASFRRSTFHLSRMSTAQLHFVDLCLLLYYGNTRSTKARVYQLAQALLKRTGGYWIDPDRCGAAVPDNLLAELLDLNIPMQAILDNPEKTPLLTKITMPSTGWFSGYTRYVDAQPDQGKQLITQRLGSGVWEQFHLVFDSFVHRAQFPLHYVLDFFPNSSG